MKGLVSNKVYDVVKHVTQIGLPAAGACYATLSHIWGWPYGPEVTATVTAVVTFLSAFLGISSAMYKEEGK